MFKKKIKKASLGLLAVADLLKKSQTAKDIGGKLGLIPKLVSDYYQGKADKKTGQVVAKQKGGEVEIGKGKDYIKDLL